MRQASAGKIGSLITFQFVQSMIELKTSVAILDLTCQPNLGAKERGLAVAYAMGQARQVYGSACNHKLVLRQCRARLRLIC